MIPGGAFDIRCLALFNSTPSDIGCLEWALGSRLRGNDKLIFQGEALEPWENYFTSCQSFSRLIL